MGTDKQRLKQETRFIRLWTLVFFVHARSSVPPGPAQSQRGETVFE